MKAKQTPTINPNSAVNPRAMPQRTSKTSIIGTIPDFLAALFYVLRIAITAKALPSNGTVFEIDTTSHGLRFRLDGNCVDAIAAALQNRRRINHHHGSDNALPVFA
ncbi:MAG TPA: hypothetical protein VL968_03295 [Rhodocyclaceae bacterium]|jgi:hypothetical protein|nr:hypothetical protein [Rhodocyclaceae bacterium]